LSVITAQNKNDKTRSVGVDVDRKDRAFRVGYTLFWLFGRGKVLMRRSASGRGWHFLIWLDREITEREAMQIRAAVGDCKGRYTIDLNRMNKHGHPEDVLFDYKNGKPAEEWRPLSLFELNPEPFWNFKEGEQPVRYVKKPVRSRW